MAKSNDFKTITDSLNRLEQQMASMDTKQRDLLSEALKSINEKLDGIEKRLESAEDSSEAQERRRSLVLIGLSENNSGKASERVRADTDAVTAIMDELNVAAPFTCYRLGRPREENGNGRLMKVVFPASVFVGIGLSSWKKNRVEMRQKEEWRRLLIRPSLDKAALALDREKRRAKWLEKASADQNVNKQRKKTGSNTNKPKN